MADHDGDAEHIVAIDPIDGPCEDSAHFIARYGSEGYYRHNKALLVYKRQEAILRELDALEPETL